MHIPLYNPLLVTTEFQDKKKEIKKKERKRKKQGGSREQLAPPHRSSLPFNPSGGSRWLSQVFLSGQVFFFSFVSYSFFFSPPLFSFLFQVSSLLLTLFTALSFLCGFSFAPFQTAGGTLAFFRFSVSPRPCRRKQAGSCGHVATVIAGKGRRDGKG